jgi:hypothetical protein
MRACTEAGSGQRPQSLATARIHAPGRRGLVAALALAPLAGACGPRAERMEATVHWAGSDLAFTQGIGRFDPAGMQAVLAFVQQPPEGGAWPAQAMPIDEWLSAARLPHVMLVLRFRAQGRATFDNLDRYSVRVGGGGAETLRVERRSSDWVRDGGIDLSGEARAGGRLLGRLRRAGADAAETTARAWRWDIGFDTVLGAA